MPSIAQRAAEGCAATDGRPSGMPCVVFFAQAKTSGVQRSVRRMPSIAQRATEGFTAKNTVHCLIFASVSLAIRKFFCASKK